MRVIEGGGDCESHRGEMETVRVIAGRMRL